MALENVVLPTLVTYAGGRCHAASRQIPRDNIRPCPGIVSGQERTSIGVSSCNASSRQWSVYFSV